MNVIITGGASGLGNAITRALGAAFPDARIWFTYFSSAENARLLEESSDRIRGMRCDFRDADHVTELCRFISGNEIDILVNNAITKLDKIHFHKSERPLFVDSFLYDILPTLEITRSFIKKARERRSGKIITILTSALQGTPPTGWSIYLSNKAYLLAMHKSWASENKSFNITSNCVSPDYLDTALHRDADPRMLEAMVQSHPLRKLLTVEEVAEVVVFLSSATAQLNGQNIVLNAAINL